jgi:hypothetical protein
MQEEKTEAVVCRWTAYNLVISLLPSYTIKRKLSWIFTALNFHYEATKRKQSKEMTTGIIIVEQDKGIQ